MQELGTRTLLTDSGLPNNLWSDAMEHGNWLRNRLPSARINQDIPILMWEPRTNVKLDGLPYFRQPVYAFIYLPETTPNKKLIYRSIHFRFIGMNSDELLLKFYIAENHSTKIFRRTYFRTCKRDRIPSITTLVDGLSSQSETELLENIDGQAQEGKMQALLSDFFTTSATVVGKKPKNPPVPQSFNESLQYKNWWNAIYREYRALKRRNTWTYVKRIDGMIFLPFTWTFRLKPMDTEVISSLNKSRCIVRGDLQNPEINYNPHGLYAPVASHDSLRMLLNIAITEHLIVEGGDVSNAYLYGDIDDEVFIEQPVD